jgi:hypothetical protein
MLLSTLPALGGAAAMMLIAQAGFVSAGGASNNDGEARQLLEPTRTGKERLGGKASDEQRLDNCKVPLDLRGPTPRPDACEDGASAKPMR